MHLRWSGDLPVAGRDRGDAAPVAHVCRDAHPSDGSNFCRVLLRRPEVDGHLSSDLRS
jgi:hypothetical protein